MDNFRTCDISHVVLYVELISCIELHLILLFVENRTSFVHSSTSIQLKVERINLSKLSEITYEKMRAVTLSNLIRTATRNQSYASHHIRQFSIRFSPSHEYIKVFNLVIRTLSTALILYLAS